ncbi:MAG: hypothetical protein RLZZ414_1839 [Bacteroidota bacterium]|jgi:hypothetical protein
MNKIVIFAMASILSISTFTQDSTKVFSKYELGLSLAKLNNFGLMYKKHFKNNSFFRLLLASMDYTLINRTDDYIHNFSSSITIGREKRKEIYDNLYVVRGWDFLGGISSTAGVNNFGFGVGYVLRLQYNLNQKFALGLETTPGITGNIIVRDYYVVFSALTLCFSTNSVRLLCCTNSKNIC